MLRRKPTRLELKIDDTEEFESVKKELEVSVVLVGRNGYHVVVVVVLFSRIQQFNNDKKIRNKVAEHRKNILKKNVHCLFYLLFTLPIYVLYLLLNLNIHFRSNQNCEYYVVFSPLILWF